MFDIRDAEIVREIVRWGGFRAAAQKLNLTQSAISARVSSLEGRLGVTIFDRRRRGAQLTPQGRAFLEQGERLVAMRNQIAAALGPQGGFAGTIRIGVAETIVHTWLAGMLTRLAESLPEMRLELSVDTSPILARKLLDNALDIAVMMTSLVPPLAVRRPIYRCPLAWYAARDYALEAEPLDIEGLSRFPIITFSRGTLPHAELEHKLPMTRLPPPLLHACASLSTTLHLTRAGLGIGLLPEPMAARDLSEGLLKQVSVAPNAAMSDLTFDFAHLPEQPGSVMEEIGAAAQHAVADIAE
ncbi:MAG: LysR family transcriptional regulator [Salinarimonas sp.]|nr:LysR family transcriptional regulator [Salinarimonas sp.]